MKPITTHKGIAAPLDRSNVDTDCIIPKQFLRKIERSGFGKHLFHELRYLNYDGTQPNPEFILNQQAYKNATVLLARENFGCGSSREHAPWALADFGFRVIIAPSFADIFYNNCAQNGILCVKLKESEVDELFDLAKKTAGPIEITTDLPEQFVTAPDAKQYHFEIDTFTKDCLMKGLDQIGWTMQFEDEIKDYENKTSAEKPWLV